MISWSALVPWMVVACLVASGIGSIVGSYFGIKICAKHWQCPLYTRKRVEDWMKDMVKERSRNKVVRTDPEAPPEVLPGEELHEVIPIR